MNKIADGIMRKNNIYAVLTETEIAHNKAISKKRYIVEQYFGLAMLFDDRSQKRFTTIVKNSIDAMFRQFASNLRKGAGVLFRRLNSKKIGSGPGPLWGGRTAHESKIWLGFTG